MQWFRHVNRQQGRLFVGLAIAGFLLGLMLMNMGQKVLLENTGLLSEYTLYEMKYSEISSNAFFWYVLRKRVGAVLIMALLSTTWLGLVASYTYSAWLGISFGMLLMAAIIRYGLKGILLIVVGVFPQGIIYLPACFFLISWCRELCNIIYFPSKMSGETGTDEAGKNYIMRRKAFQFLSLVVVVIIGCFFESYVNPKLLLNLLQIF